MIRLKTSEAIRLGVYTPPPNRTCTICEKHFYASPGHIKNGWGIYCSINCRSAGQRGEVYGGKKRAPKMICGTCGTSFSCRPSHVKAGEGKFCSLKCRAVANNVLKTCKGCGREFDVYKSHAVRQVFCSGDCMRDFTRKKDNCICVSCGAGFNRKPCDLKRGEITGDGKNSGRFCGMQCKAKFMSTDAERGGRYRGRGGKRADLADRYFRSSWEANWARYLNWLISLGEIKSWEYEVDTFEFMEIKRGARFYTPDFKVFARDGSFVYHEVKGWMDPTSKTKLKRMTKYYPEVKVILIDRPYYRDVAKKLFGVIPGWEGKRWI